MLSATGIKKGISRKKTGGVFEFSAVSSFTAMLFFLILSKGHLKMPAEVLPYSIGYALSYALSAASSIVALNL